MLSLTALFRRVGRVLFAHVRKLRHALDLLQDQVRAALTRAIGQATGEAVRDALAVILDGPPTERSIAREPFDDHGFWHEPRPQPWMTQRHDDYAPCEDDEDQDDEADPHTTAADPDRQPASLWARAVGVGCQAAGWWLRRHPGRFAPLAAACVGSAAAIATLLGGPFVAGVSAVAVSALGVLALADAARSAVTRASAAMP
jgi:hypothetical protein